MYYLYILKSTTTGEFYKGITYNLAKRLKEHSLGKVLSTKSKRPLNLIHVEICSSRLEARKLEVFFKNGFGREIIQAIAAVVKW